MTGATDPRAEAERLIAAALGTAAVAADGLRGFATGSAECCVCPVCRAIAAARDPDPEFAERMASGAAELAAGLAAALRNLSRAGQSAPAPGGPASDAGARDDEADPWRAATRAAAAEAARPPGAAEPAAPPPAGSTGPTAPTVPAAPAAGPAAPAGPAAQPPKPMAKKAVKPKKAVPPPADAGGPDAGSEGHGDEGAD